MLKRLFNCVKSLILLGAVAHLTGCATSTLSSQEAKAFKSMSLGEFLEHRFNDGREAQFHGNTVRYSAFFNSANNVQLSRPTTELSNFCSAGGGQFTAIIRYTGDPVGKFFLNPTSEALSGAAYAVAIGRPELAYTVASMVYNEAMRVNALFNSEATKAAYNNAAASGIYGTFSCGYKDKKQNDWRVNVLPVGFKPRDPSNHLIVSELIIEIAPLRAK